MLQAIGEIIKRIVRPDGLGSSSARHRTVRKVLRSGKEVCTIHVPSLVSYAKLNVFYQSCSGPWGKDTSDAVDDTRKRRRAVPVVDFCSAALESAVESELSG